MALRFTPSATAPSRPRCTTLYRLVQQHAATFIAETEAIAGADLPQFVKDEFDAFLECGILAHRLARAIEERPSVARAKAEAAPDQHLIRLHGVWAPNAKLRAQVVPQEPQAPAQAAPPADCPSEVCAPSAAVAELGPAPRAKGTGCARASQDRRSGARSCA